MNVPVSVPEPDLNLFGCEGFLSELIENKSGTGTFTIFLHLMSSYKKSINSRRGLQGSLTRERIYPPFHVTMMPRVCQAGSEKHVEISRAIKTSCHRGILAPTAQGPTQCIQSKGAGWGHCYRSKPLVGNLSHHLDRRLRIL